MYASTPPPDGPDGPGEPGGRESPGGGWGLRRAVRLGFPQPDPPGRDDARAAYHRDLLRPFGLGLDEQALEAGGHSYGAMGRALIETAVPAHGPVDLLVLAYAIPDLAPGRATATYLSHLCPGRPMAFAVSDQGTAAAFTGLRLVGEYARSGGVRRAVLLVLEQAALPYDPGVAVLVPTGHTGVALLFGPPAHDAPDPAGPHGAAARMLRVASASVHTGCPQAQLADLAGAAVAVPGTCAILGSGLAACGLRPPGTGARPHRAAPDGQPYTGVWWELAGVFAAAEPPGRVVLLDADPASRALCVAAFEAPPAPAPAPDPAGAPGDGRRR
jgi:4-hydroxymandelate oxidase